MIYVNNYWRFCLSLFLSLCLLVSVCLSQCQILFFHFLLRHKNPLLTHSLHLALVSVESIHLQEYIFDTLNGNFLFFPNSLFLIVVSMQPYFRIVRDFKYIQIQRVIVLCSKNDSNSIESRFQITLFSRSLTLALFFLKVSD